MLYEPILLGFGYWMVGSDYSQDNGVITNTGQGILEILEQTWKYDKDNVWMTDDTTLTVEEDPYPCRSFVVL